MKRIKRIKALFIILCVLLGVSIIAYIALIPSADSGQSINSPLNNFILFIVIVLSIVCTLYGVYYASEKALTEELILENTFALGRPSTFYNLHAMQIRLKAKRRGKLKRRPAYVLAFSPSNKAVITSVGRNSVISIFNGYISEYFKNYFASHGRRIRKTNLYCYYHGYFILYSFLKNEFLNNFIQELSASLFKIAEENQIHIFVQPLYGITEVLNPKENLFVSIENALTARNYSEKNFQEKTYYDEKLIKTVTDDDIKEIQQAMENREFVVYYQPKFSLKTNEVVGSEALIRWNSPKYGFSSPDKFLPKAEEGGIMQDIDMYVFRTVCEDLAEAKRKGRRMLPVSVNFSLYEFYEPNFLNRLIEIIKSLDLDPKYIEVEITESTSQANSFLAVSYLKKIKEQGLQILMDDFGTGYSNIANLNKLPIDKVKIDKSLVDYIVEDSRTRESVRYLINLCIANGMESIAEGVDNAKQVEILRRLHCDVIQGYFYSRPISKEAYENFLADNKFEKKKKSKGGDE